jgi:hypothetical protein
MPERHANVAEIFDASIVASSRSGPHDWEREPMANEAVRSVTIEVALDTKNQTRDRVVEALDLILRRGGCPHCGLMGVVAAKLAESPTQK